MGEQGRFRTVLCQKLRFRLQHCQLLLSAWRYLQSTSELLPWLFGSQLLSSAKTSSLTVNVPLFLFFYSQFTETFLTERDKLSKWSGIPQLLLKLYATSHLHSDFVECQSILKVTDRALERLCSGSSDSPNYRPFKNSQLSLYEL